MKDESGVPFAGFDATALSALFDRSPIPSLIYDSETFEVRAVNDAAVAIYAHTREELIDQPVFSLLCAEDSEHGGAVLRDEFEWSGRAQYRRSDGELVLLEYACRPLVYDARPARLIFLTSQRTANPGRRSNWGQPRLEQQGEIEDREGSFRGVVEAAPDAMILVDVSGKIALVNAQTEKLFGYTREELIGAPIERLVPARFRDRHPDYRGAYFGSPQVRPMGAGLELHATRKDGSEFPAEISLSPVVTSRGTFAAAAIRDATEQKLRREEEIRIKSRELENENRRMQEANRLKSEFLANMSHELRTPLNAVIGFAELMFKGKVGPVSERHQEYLGDILTSSRHLLQLINDVLDLAKVESGKLEFQPETLDLAKVVNEVRDILRGLAASKGIRVATEVLPEVATVTLDPSKLKQVLYNYLSNALKFTPDGGSILVRAIPEDEHRVRLEVRDTGIGVRSEDLNRLFVEFQQLDSGSAKKYPGTGLGLALTRRIVEAQGGQVGVESHFAKGSLFWATLPRH
jgi:protein-histidine pros-kinase